MLQRIAHLGRIEKYPEDAVILREGEAGNELFLIREGEVRTYIKDDNGHRFVIGMFGPGVLFGEGAFDGGPRTATVEAITPVTALVMSYQALKEEMQRNPSFAFEIVMLLIARSRSSTARIKSLALDTAYKRLRALLGPEPGQTVITQQEIADLIGTSRDMVTRIFRDLVQGGYIRTFKGKVEIVRTLPAKW